MKIIKEKNAIFLYQFGYIMQFVIDFIFQILLKNHLIDHQSQGEKYDLDNSKIFDNFSEFTGKDFEIYLETFFHYMSSCVSMIESPFLLMQE